MHIRIPHFPKAKDAEPLERCLEYASARTGVDHYTAILFMTHFLDQLADENTRGHTVSIPGFGMFAPYLREANNLRPATAGQKFLVVPRFNPAKAFRDQVRWGCPPKDEGRRKFKQHQKNNAPSGRKGKDTMRVFTAMQSIRDNIAAQLGHAHDD